MNQKDKVLVLSCGTGGGHNSAARAIQEKLIEKGIEANFVEYLEIINPKIKDHVNHLYLKSTNKNGKVFKVVYRLGELYEKTNIKSPVYYLNKLSKKRLYQYIKENRYQYIVTTHLFAAQALTAIKKEYEIHFMQIATDYVSIPFWEETNPDYFVIPSKELEKDFATKRKKKENILPIGIPVAKAYTQKYKMEDSKQKLKLDTQKRYVLVLTGSMGFGNVLQMVEELEKKIKEVVFIVSCGNNEKLQKDLIQKYGTENTRVIPLPFTNKISEYMKSSEIILSKPGGLTTTEIATLRKPFIHTMPIPGCENYNADFFSSRKMSIQCHSVKEVVEKTQELLNDKSLQEEMIKKQEQYINQEATDEMVNVIIKEIKKGKK